MSRHIVLEDGLTIEHEYGSVRWKGPIRLREGLSLEKIVVFRPREIEIYPDQRDEPPIGEELNKPAEVTLNDVWPANNTRPAHMKIQNRGSLDSWVESLQRKIESMGAHFKNYDFATGSLQFSVDHFSKYGINDVDDDDVPMVDAEISRKEADLQLYVQRAKTDNFVEAVVNDPPVPSTPRRIREIAAKTPGFHAPVTPAFSITPLRNFKRKPAFPLTFNDKDPFFEPLPAMSKDIYFEERQALRSLDEENQLVKDQGLHGKRQYDEGGTVHKRARTIESAPNEEKMKASKKIRLIEPQPRIPLLPSTLTTRPTDGGPIDIVAAQGVYAPVNYIAKSGGMMTVVKPETNMVAVMPLDFPDDLEIEFLEESIKINANYSKFSVQLSEPPHQDQADQRTCHLEPFGDFQQLIRSYIEIHNKHNKKCQIRLWTLCELLFQKNDGCLEEWHQRRSQQMGRWIKDVLKEEEATSIWDFISLGKCDEIASSPLTHFLITASLSLCHDINVRLKAEKQILYWMNNGQLDLINEQELKAYMVVAGKRHLKWKRSSGEEVFINIYNGLHWLQAFGLNVWYLGEENEPISKSIDRLLEDAEQNLLLLPERDPAWELIRFAGSEHRPLESCLEAAEFCSPWVSDYYPSWHMWAAIHTVGTWKLQPAAEEKLHRRYAAQLMSYGAIHLSVFVLSHIQNEYSRESAIQDLLIAEAASLNDNVIRKTLELVQIPDRIIYTALAVNAKANFDVRKEFQYRVRAKDWLGAEKLYINNLAIEAVLIEDNSELIYWTDQLTSDLGVEHRWSPKTLLFAEYSFFNVLIEKHDVTSNPEIIQLCNSIDERLDKEDNPKGRLRDALSIIAYRIAAHRMKIGAPTWVTGKVAGKRFHRLGLSLADLVKIHR